MRKIILIVCILVIAMMGFSQENKSTSHQLSLTEQLAYVTVRIESDKGDTGTGFFFNFLEVGNTYVQAIVTNKHVIRGMNNGTFILTAKNEDGTPNNKKHIPFTFENFNKMWIMHPDPNVDLAIFLIKPILEKAFKKGIDLFFIPLSRNTIPSDDSLKELSVVEDILMVGYPIGLWDRVNNAPLFRKGITSSHPFNDFNGKSEFVIDAACYPGSSGSPVVISNPGRHENKKGTMNMFSRFYFLGILYAGPQYTTRGDIVIIDIPTKKEAFVASRIPINLGYVIKSKNLYEFDTLLKKNIK